MSRYARNNPDEPVNFDWFAGGKRETQAAEKLAAAIRHEHDELKRELAEIDEEAKDENR